MQFLRTATVGGVCVLICGCAGVADFVNPLNAVADMNSDASNSAGKDSSMRTFSAPAGLSDTHPGGSSGSDSGSGPYYGTGAQAYYIYEPTGVTSAPVIAFFHAYQTLDPANYGGWIKRLVDAKYIVVYPVYQDYVSLDIEWTGAAINAVKSAYVILGQSGHVHAAAGKFGVIGHSIGAAVAMNVAALATANGIPAPKIMLMANPGDATSVLDLPSMLVSDFSAIPSTTRYFAITGDLDTVVGTQTAIDFYNLLSQIPNSQRTVIECMTDMLGLPPIIAQHGSCLATDPNFDSGPPPHVEASGGNWTVGPGGAAIAPAGEADQPTTEAAADGNSEGAGRPIYQAPGGPVTATIDTMDYKAYWAVGDAMLNWGFHGATFSLPPGGAPNTMSMGNWSDGTPVKPAQYLLP